MMTVQSCEKERIMSSVAKVIEIIASSEISFEDAVANGVAKASESIKDITSALARSKC